MIQNALSTQLVFTYMTAQANLDGISHADSLAAPPKGGNGINWVLGHVVNTRGVMLDLLGAAPVLGARGKELYGRGSKAIGPGAPCLSLEELRRLLDASQATLRQKLAAADEAALAREVPDLFDAAQKTTCAVKLAQLLFHEAYHMGQIGTIRRAIGKEPGIR
ncbi:MAG: DinB family protein [Planctomycetota bacterium]